MEENNENVTLDNNVETVNETNSGGYQAARAEVKPELNDVEIPNVEYSIEEPIVEKEKKKHGKKILLFVLLLLIIGGGVAAYFLLFNNKTKESPQIEKKTEVKEQYSKYRLTSNGLEDFDLYFLGLEEKEKNQVYSPLSIKYALQMLSEGSNGETKKQLDSIIGDYKYNKYTNSKNMAFANAMFVNSSSKDSIKASYKDNLKTKYNAEVIIDDFSSSKNLNAWIKDHTLNLISNLFTDDYIKDKTYILTNALAIDMEWKTKIRAKDDVYMVEFPHEKYAAELGPFYDYSGMYFNETQKVKMVPIAAVINKYDIVKTLGEDNIRKTVGAEYKKYYETSKEEPKNYTPSENEINSYLDKYIEEIGKNYNYIDKSTDFSVYVDDDVKVFGKDLKTYNNTTLEYIAIMPQKEKLKDFINNNDSKSINEIVNKLKDIKLENFKDGVVTDIYGDIPVFKFDYQMDLKTNLEKLGVTDVFDLSKADLSGISSEKTAIEGATHKATIDFSNDGIKAAAVTEEGGYGNASGGFDYIYDVPIEYIDITFNKPFMFLIRDKSSKEVWFAGTVYNPTEYKGDITLDVDE